MSTESSSDPTLVSLADCPIGLFLMPDGAVGVKTEYQNNKGLIAAYIVSSGELLWGPPPRSIASQRAFLVRPLCVTDIPFAIVPRVQPMSGVYTVSFGEYRVGWLGWQVLSTYPDGVKRPASPKFWRWKTAARVAQSIVQHHRNGIDMGRLAGGYVGAATRVGEEAD